MPGVYPPPRNTAIPQYRNARADFQQRTAALFTEQQANSEQTLAILFWCEPCYPRPKPQHILHDRTRADGAACCLCQGVCRKWKRLCCETQELSLKWANCILNGRNRIDGAIKLMVTHFQNLRRIDLMTCHNASAEAIMVLCSATKTTLARTESINMEGMPELRDSAVECLSKLTALKELNVSKCQRITTVGLKALAEGGANLTRLNVSYNLEVVPDAAPGVEWPPPKLSKLQAISIRGCPNLTPDLFENLLKTCNVLKMLDAPVHVGDMDLNCIAKHCRQLEHLDISYAYYPTDDGVQAIAADCKNLKSLNLEGCQLLTDAALLAIGESVQLEWLDISFCLNISDASVIKLAKNGSSRLRTLRMTGLWRLTDNSVLQFTHRAAVLEFLDITDCSKVTQEAIEAFALSRPELQIGGAMPAFCPLLAQAVK